MNVSAEHIDKNLCIVKKNLGVCIIKIPSSQAGFKHQYLSAKDPKRRVDILSWFLLTQVDEKMRIIEHRISSTELKRKLNSPRMPQFLLLTKSKTKQSNYNALIIELVSEKENTSGTLELVFNVLYKGKKQRFVSDSVGIIDNPPIHKQ